MTNLSFLKHVVDSSAPNLEEHRSTVLQVLQQIGVSEEKLQNMIEVWNKIDVEEECMDADEYLDEDEEADETSSFDGEEDANAETLTETEKDHANSISGSVNEDIEEADNHTANCVSELSPADSEVIEEDNSDGWLYEEDTLVSEGDFCSPSMADLQNVSSNKDSGMIGPSGPHVKVSAITGVGLQELMELVDEKLSSQNQKLKAAHVVERNFVDRKWRPSHTQDSSIAVEQ